MVKKSNATVFERLCKDLGRVDKERRQILKELKQTPEFVDKYLNETLTNFVHTRSWFSRANAKDELAYFKLVGFKFGGENKITPKNGVMLIAVDLEWDHYNYSSVTKTKCVEHVTISVFHDIENQVLNGRKPASSFDEKKLLKALLSEKRDILKDQLKSLEAEIKAIV